MNGGLESDIKSYIDSINPRFDILYHKIFNDLFTTIDDSAKIYINRINGTEIKYINSADYVTNECNSSARHWKDTYGYLVISEIFLSEFASFISREDVKLILAFKKLMDPTEDMIDNYINTFYSQFKSSNMAFVSIIQRSIKLAGVKSYHEIANLINAVDKKKIFEIIPLSKIESIVRQNYDIHKNIVLLSRFQTLMKNIAINTLILILKKYKTTDPTINSEIDKLKIKEIENCII